MINFRDLQSFFLILFAVFILMSCSEGNGEEISESNNKAISAPVNEYGFSVDMLNQKTVAVTIGTACDNYMTVNYPNADLLRVESLADIAPMIMSGKVSYALLDLTVIKLLMETNDEFVIMTEELFQTGVGAAFNKENVALHQEFNAFLDEFLPTPTCQDIFNRWLKGADNSVIPNIEIPNTGKILRVACSSSSPPSVTMVNNKIEGYEVELIRHFAKVRGYSLEFTDMNFAGMISALTTGKADIAICEISITDERKKNMLFSTPYNNASLGVFGKRQTPTTEVKEELGFFENLSNSFQNNIIKEDRYKLVFQGLYVTVVISIFSIILGTILGMLVCYMTMHRSAFLRGFGNGFISIIRGTPVLVLLMINFYVIFATTSLSPEIVAILSFALNFAAYVSEMFRTSIQSIDKGQTEAGLAMGFSKLQTFVFVIAPQAIKRVLPVFKGEAISLIKMTSVVGYIAVQDITKVGDIIRSRTFDAFFPLLVSALLYFVLAYLFMKILDLLTLKITRRAYDNNK